MAAKGSTASRSAARGAARVSAAVSSGRGASLNSRGQALAASTSKAASAAASQATVRAAAQKATQQAAAKATASMVANAASRGATRAASIAATQGIGSLNDRGKTMLSSANAAKLDAFTANRLSVLNEQAKTEMQQDPEFQQAYPEISTFFSNLGKYDLETQQGILDKIQKEANAQVDSGFNSEQDFVNRLKQFKNEAIQNKLGNFKDQERQSLDKILGELSRNAGDAGTKYFANLASSNALDTGTLGSFADRLVEDLTRQQKQEKDASALAVKSAEDAATADKNIADMTAENALFIGDDSIFARREAARGERYASLLGINADQDLLAQTPTALNTGMVPKPTTSQKQESSSYIPSRIPSSLRTPAPVVSLAQSRGAARAQVNAAKYGASSLNSRGRSLLGNF